MTEAKYHRDKWADNGTVERSTEFMVKKSDFNSFLLNDNFLKSTKILICVQEWPCVKYVTLLIGEKTGNMLRQFKGDSKE